MTSATIPGLDAAPTNHAGLLAWVREVAELTQPDRVMFADGSAEAMMESGLKIWDAAAPLIEFAAAAVHSVPIAPEIVLPGCTFERSMMRPGSLPFFAVGTSELGTLPFGETL